MIAVADELAYNPTGRQTRCSSSSARSAARLPPWSSARSRPPPLGGGTPLPGDVHPVKRISCLGTSSARTPRASMTRPRFDDRPGDLDRPGAFGQLVGGEAVFPRARLNRQVFRFGELPARPRDRAWHGGRRPPTASKAAVQTRPPGFERAPAPSLLIRRPTWSWPKMVSIRNSRITLVRLACL